VDDAGVGPNGPRLDPNPGVLRAVRPLDGQPSFASGSGSC
jgi:hypothetical protein